MQVIKWILPVIFAAAGVFLSNFIHGHKFLGLCCFCLAGLLICYFLIGILARHNIVTGKVLRTILSCLLCFGILIFLGTEIIILNASKGSPETDCPYIVVLGAKVNGTSPSLSLSDRIRAAENYLKAHPDTIAVLSGGQGPGEDITEAEAMRRVLEETGAVLLLEERSTSTEENLAFSKEVLKEHGVDAESARVAIVTNGFHVTRACMLAYEQGYSEVFGIGAPLPWWLQGNYYLREAFALIKDMIF